MPLSAYENCGIDIDGMGVILCFGWSSYSEMGRFPGQLYVDGQDTCIQKQN